MTAAETATFEAELARDAELAALVQQHRLERQGLELLVERELFTKMNAWDRETELFQKAQPRRDVLRPMTWVMRVAAVLVLAAFGYWMVEQKVFSHQTKQPHQLCKLNQKSNPGCQRCGSLQTSRRAVHPRQLHPTSPQIWRWMIRLQLKKWVEKLITQL